MPTGTISFKLKNHPQFEDLHDVGWPLIYLWMSANALNRAWPKVETIASKTGRSLGKTDEILDWLHERGALLKVPYECRLLEEKKLPVRKSVYQLTGVMQLGGEWVHYMHFQPGDEALITIYEAIKSIEQVQGQRFEISLAEISLGEISQPEIKGKPIETPKGKPKGKGDSAQKKRATTTPAKPRLKDMVSHPLWEAYVEAMNYLTPPVFTNEYKRLALEMEALGYTAEQVTTLVTSKVNGGKQRYDFNWLAEDLPPFVQEHQPKPAPTGRWVPDKGEEPEPQQAEMLTVEEMAQRRANALGQTVVKDGVTYYPQKEMA